jgi:hypothetical protein
MLSSLTRPVEVMTLTCHVGSIILSVRLVPSLQGGSKRQATFPPVLQINDATDLPPDFTLG